MAHAGGTTQDGAVVVALGPRDPFAREARRVWRRLTGGPRVRDRDRRTLVACSGGADSSALALALAGVGRGAPGGRPVVLGHVVHDLRAPEEALADRDAVRALAATLGLDVVEGRAAVRGLAGNAEALARRARYRELARLASDVGARFVATAHHADDQLETVLMRLVRGAGPRGLAGIRASRPLGAVTLVRPMLEIDRAACESACLRAGWAWREDATNGDQSRLRAALRARVTPELRRLAPGLGGRVASACRLMEDAAGEVRDRAREIADDARRGPGLVQLERGALRRARAAVAGEVVRAELDRAGVRLDDAGGRRVGPIVRAIREDSTEPRDFVFGGVRVRVLARWVEVRSG